MQESEHSQQATLVGPEPDSPRAGGTSNSANGSSWLEWPRNGIVFGAAVLVLYWHTLVDAVHIWLTAENYAHGVFIIPICLGLLYLNRERIRRADVHPSAWGLAFLVPGLAVMCIAHYLRASIIPMWTLVPVLLGGVLLLHGTRLFRVTAFPIGYLVFGAQIPFGILYMLNMWIKSASTSGAAAIMRGLGYSIIQSGNLIEIPGFSLEVADVCSGYKKLTALVAFAFLYAYIFRASWWRTVLLIASAIPIAVFTNAIRVAGLVAVTSAWGQRGLNIAHNSAEMVVLVVAFILFVQFGKLIGCKTPALFQSQPSV